MEAMHSIDIGTWHWRLDTLAMEQEDEYIDLLFNLPINLFP